MNREYPVASDRGGVKADFNNLVTFLQNLRTALKSNGNNFGLSITIPSSYWYLQHFDIVNIAKTIDWFNIMTYDLHGTWGKFCSECKQVAVPDKFQTGQKIRLGPSFRRIRI